MKMLLVLTMSVLIITPYTQAEIKQASDVFSRWTDSTNPCFQRIIPDVSLNKQVTATTQQEMCTAIQPLKSAVLKLAGDETGHISTRKIKRIHQQIARSMPLFVKNLEHTGFASKELDALDEKDTFDNALKRYRQTFKLLFADSAAKSVNHEFAIANRFTEFCFGHHSFSQFRKIIKNEPTKPIARFLYTGMWKTLSGNGWRCWHKETLNRLRTAYEKGKTIVYVAGGSDIYQLLAHGIYNIRIIDPQLPDAQDAYYADQWQWLLKGDGATAGIGDELHFSAGNKKIVARRTSVKEGQEFAVKLSNGENIHPRTGNIVWDIFEDNVRKGSLTFERRLAKQDDFVPRKNEELLMSFNELYFIALPAAQGGWPIDPHKLPNGLSMHIKQLRKPFTKQMLENMSWVERNNLSYLCLGTCVK